VHAADDLPRFIHHLGPRYFGNFQDPDLMKFLTYEASTSLNMFLSSAAAKNPALETPLLKIAKEGLGVGEASIVFSVSPLSRLEQAAAGSSGGAGSVLPTMNGSSRDFASPSGRSRFGVVGDVFVVRLLCLDEALWRIGGVAVALRLVQLANVSGLSLLCFARLGYVLNEVWLI
jgi:hypothetical protein